MALESQTSIIEYAGNGSSVTPYDVTFPFLENEDIYVVVVDADGVETQLVLDVEYTVSGGSGSTGSILTTAAIPAESKIVIYRDPEQTQLMALAPGGPFPVGSVERAFDRLTMMVQSLQRRLNRSIRVTDSSPVFPAIEIQNPASRIMGFDEGGLSKLFTAAQLLNLLEITGSVTGKPVAVWDTAAQRATKVADYTGQVGVQTEDWTLWISQSTTAGNWVPSSIEVLNDPDLGSSTTLPPSQDAVQKYVDAVAAETETAAATDATTKANAVQNALTPIGNTLARFTPRDNQPPSTNFATLRIVNSISILIFNDAVQSNGMFVGVLPQGLSWSGVKVHIHWFASATTGGVRWEVAIDPLVGDMTADNFDTNGTGTGNPGGTAELLVETPIDPVVTGLTTGKPFRLRVRRAVAHGDDTMEGFARIVLIELRRVA